MCYPQIYESDMSTKNVINVYIKIMKGWINTHLNNDFKKTFTNIWTSDKFKQFFYEMIY